MTTPLMKMYTLGHYLHPRARARRRPALPRDGADRLGTPRAGPDRGRGRDAEPGLRGCASRFARAEGIIPAPEAAHAIRVAIDEALKAKEAGEEKVIAFNLSGHGHFDMGAYDEYFAGNLPDFEYDESLVEAALSKLPAVGAPA